MKKCRYVLFAVVGAVLFLVGLDYAYSVLTRIRYTKWEAGIARDAQGVRVDFAPYQVGEGDVGILFVHGFASSPALFTRMARTLADAGYACRVLRLPGFGEPIEQSARIRADDWLDHVGRELEILRRKHDRVFIVGHSMGGTIALLTAQANPEHVQGLILLGPLFDVSRRRSPMVPPRKWFQISERLMLFTEIFETAFPIDAVDPAVNKLEQRDLFLPRTIYAEMFEISDRANGLERLHDIPLLVILATEDKVVNNRATEAFFRDAPHPDSVIHLHTSGHVIPLDRGWEEVTKRVVGFIRDRE